MSSIYLTVTAEAGSYAVYLFGEKEPCLVWQDSDKDGGVISLVSENSRTGFYHVMVEDITGGVQKKEKPAYLVSRNGIPAAPAGCYAETGPKDVVYRWEPFFRDTETYVLELDIIVHEPWSARCFPVIYVRGNANRKIGLYSDGTGTYLADQNREIIADEDAESTWIFAKQQADTLYHICIESEPDYISVWINGCAIYRRQPLAGCLSGDFSGLPIAPEIVCVQGEGGNTRTELQNVCIRAV